MTGGPGEGHSYPWGPDSQLLCPSGWTSLVGPRGMDNGFRLLGAQTRVRVAFAWFYSVIFDFNHTRGLNLLIPRSTKIEKKKRKKNS